MRSWKKLWEGHAEALVQTCFLELVGKYSEGGRHYHNMQHLGECLQELHLYKSEQDYKPEVEIAVWFHDVVYNPSNSDNEEKSADFAEDWMKRFGVADEAISQVKDLIMATKHLTGATNLEAKLLLDVDLSILGKGRERFEEYEKQIRAEYSFVPEDIYKAKRGELLRGFLQRPQIYQISYFHNKYEDQARQNLEQSIERLCT